MRRPEKRCVFRLDIKAGKILDHVTSDARVFCVFAAAASNARSPIVRSRVGGEVENEQSRCQLRT